jgi:hypothetical protein
LELENLELFDPVAQELYRLHPATIHTFGKLNNQPTVTLEQDPKSKKSRFDTGHSVLEHQRMT